MSRSDPIRTDYYAAVQMAGKVSDVLFYVNAFLSCATLLLDRAKQPELYDLVLLAFSLSVVAMFTIGLILRLHLTPRAEDRRRQDFFGRAYNVNLLHKATDGYYNNDAKEPIKRIAAQTLENSHFSKAITLRMVRWERWRVGLYLLLWLILLHYRKTDLGWIVVASQAVFSEQIVSKWARLEWLHRRCEKTFDSLYRVMQSMQPLAQRDAQAMEYMLAYETAKANAGITMSSKYFDEMNAELSAEWNKIRADIGL